MIKCMIRILNLNLNLDLNLNLNLNLDLYYIIFEHFRKYITHTSLLVCFFLFQNIGPWPGFLANTLILIPILSPVTPSASLQ